MDQTNKGRAAASGAKGRAVVSNADRSQIHSSEVSGSNGISPAPGPKRPIAKPSRQQRRYQQRTAAKAREHDTDVEREIRVAYEQLQTIDPNVAGVDVGSVEHFVAAPDGPEHVLVRTVGCFTPDLSEAADWLIGRGIHSVVMESTGVYWVPIYQVFVDKGLKVILVDARYAKNLPGRKKTDVHDSAWLRKLQSYGLLRPCFVPEKSIEEMRTYWRHRATLIEQASRQVLLMQKACEQMNLQVHKALSDVTGVTGMRIIRAILSGERDPVVLARLRHERVKCSEEELVKALTANYRVEHLFTLKQAVDAYDFLHRQVEECDGKLQACMIGFTPQRPDQAAAELPVESQTAGQNEAMGQDRATTARTAANATSANATGGDATKAGPTAARRRRKRIRKSANAPKFNIREEQNRILGVDLTAIDGIDVMTVQTLLSEFGPTLSEFETEGRFSSFLGLSPNNRITGGKIKSSSTNKVRHRFAKALRQSAESLHHSHSALGAYYRRMHARLGPAKAITAVAHKLACLVFRMIKFGQEYVDRGQEWYEERYERSLRERLAKQARHLGLQLVVSGSGEVVS